LLSSLAVICGAVVFTARLAIVFFPISAPAQEVVKGEANLLHRAPIEYPSDALAHGIQGTVVVEAKLNEKGVVTDAHVVSGPDALRRAALKSVLEWHYTGRAQSPVEIAIDFKPPAPSMTPATPARIVTGGLSQANAGAARPFAPVSETGRLKHIQFSGLSAQLREALSGHLPVQEGDEIQADSLQRIRTAVRDVDEHLDVRLSRQMNTDAAWEYSLQIVSTAPMETPASEAGVPRLRIGGNAQSAKQIFTPKPVYPPEAKQKRIQGTVKLNVVIGKEGAVQDVQVASGDPLLAEAAVGAVRQWIYQTTLLNGNPVEVATVVDVNFTLSQ
jgi:TonB family protein